MEYYFGSLIFGSFGISLMYYWEESQYSIFITTVLVKLIHNSMKKGYSKNIYLKKDSIK